MTTPVSLYTARELCELVLRKVGAYSPSDTGADSNLLLIALDFMEIEIASLAGTSIAQWLIPKTIEFVLTANTDNYLLSTIAGDAFPDLGVVYPMKAYIGKAATLDYDAQSAAFTVGSKLTGGTSGATATIIADDDDGATGTLTLRRIFGDFEDDETITDAAGGSATANGTPSSASDAITPIEIIRRGVYEEIPDKTATGDPEAIYIDRLANNTQNLFVYPVPSDSTTTLRLVAMTYPQTVKTDLSVQSGAGDTAHGFDRVVQKWMVAATALEVGDGPIRQLKSEKLERIKKERDKIFKELEAHYNRERVSPQGRRTARWGEGGGMRRRPYGGIWKH